MANPGEQSGRPRFQSLPERKRIIEEQRKYWDEDFWRDWALYPAPPEIKIGDSASLLRAERDVQTLAEFTAFTSHTLMENTGRLWLVRELELMDSEAFVKKIEDASAQGNAAVIYLAGFIIDTRVWLSDEERARVRIALTKAEREINLPERTRASEILQECKELILDIESAYLNLTTGKEDLRSKVQPYRQERKARAEAEAAAEAERKRQFETMNDNLILKGAV